MKKKGEKGYSVPLFDRIFKPREIRLPNGHTVMQPHSRLPLILAVTAGAVWLSISLTGFDLGIIARRGNQFLVILRQIFSPDVFVISEDTFAKFASETFPERPRFAVMKSMVSPFFSRIADRKS